MRFPGATAESRAPRACGLRAARGACIVRAMSFTATVQNDTIKLPAGVHLPDGTEVSIEPREKPGQTFAERYAEFIGIADDLPPDFAINHDHYLHGARKQA